MKIAITQPRASYFIGGSEKTALRHAEYLYKIFGVEVDFYTTVPIGKNFSEVYTKAKENTGVNFIELKIPQKHVDIYSEQPGISQTRWDSESILFSGMVYENLHKGNHDLILNYYFVDLLFKPLDKPNIVYLGGYPREKIILYNSFIKFCDATFSNSEAVFNQWKDVFEYSKTLKNFIIKKGIDPIDTEKLENKLSRGNFNIVYVGRLVSRKGVDILIKSFCQNVEQYQDMKLWIIGDGPENVTLRSLAKTYPDKIIFIGEVVDIYNYLYFADICVFPSIQGEGLMTTLCEAMMCGKCCVTTNDPTNKQVIVDEQNGFLIESGNIDQLSQKIEFLYLNKEVRNKVGNNAKVFAEKNFQWQSVISDIYEKLKTIINDFNTHA